MNDPYLDRSTGILRNKVGASTDEELRLIEAKIVAAKDAALIRFPIAGRFGADHLRDIHRYLFDDIYDWAGQFRTVDIAKGRSYFCRAVFLEQQATAVFTPCQNLGPWLGRPRAEVIEFLAEVLSEVNALHPFREGNGRSQRTFIRQMARELGWAMNWASVNPADNEQASISAMNGDVGPLKTLMESITTPL